MIKNLIVAAAGDSWGVELPFDFATGGGIPKSLFELCMGISVYPNIAHAGDSTEETMGLRMSQKLEAILPGCHILLFTGGGDDFAGDQFKIFLNENTDGDVNKAVNWHRLNAALDLMIADYEDLTEIRDRVAPDCLIVTQSYDFPPVTVMGHGVLTFGPWLKPGLEYCGWHDAVKQAEIVKLVLMTFQSRMSMFAAQNRNHLHVNTQGICTAGDWANELHLNSSGCLKVARAINAALLPWLDKINGITTEPDTAG